MANHSTPKTFVPPSVHHYLAEIGSRGGKRGSREAKSRAGKLGIRAMRAKLEAEAQKKAEAP